VSFLRKLTELKDPQGWVHHVADAATGKLLTTQLDRPVTPLSRAERLSQLGHQFPIFPPPTHRLTPRQPYQASPQGFLDFQWASDTSSYINEPQRPCGLAFAVHCPPMDGTHGRLAARRARGALSFDSTARRRHLAGSGRPHSHRGERSASGKRAANRIVRHTYAGGSHRTPFRSRFRVGADRSSHSLDRDHP
jgi:hypothetical protein